MPNNSIWLLDESHAELHIHDLLALYWNNVNPILVLYQLALDMYWSSKSPTLILCLSVCGPVSSKSSDFGAQVLRNAESSPAHPLKFIAPILDGVAALLGGTALCGAKTTETSCLHLL